MWEEWYMGGWPTLPVIDSWNIQVKINGSWYDVTSTYGHELAFSEIDGDPFPPEDFPYIYDWNVEFHDWYVVSP